MSDIDILREMIAEKALVSLQTDSYDKREIVLEELEHYHVLIKTLLSDHEVIVIKGDAFPSLKDIFLNNNRHECKRCDFIIVVANENRRFMIFIELKARANSLERDIISQFKGAECLMAYCCELGRKFWEQKSFLDKYQKRFVSIRDIGLDKRPTRLSSSKIHDTPENMLKIKSPKYLELEHLICKTNN